MPSEAALQMLLDAWSQTSDGVGSSHNGCANQQTGGDTLCMETRSDVKRQDEHVQNDTWMKVGTSKPIGIHQVKDGDIRLRWTSLAPASDGAARSAAANGWTWRAAHYLVSRLSSRVHFVKVTPSTNIEKRT